MNNHGYNHEMLTVKKCWSVMTQGQPESQYSWFPGYTWQIINCPECWSHLGWCFRATRDELKPRMFYGLTKTAIVDGGDIDSDQGKWLTDRLFSSKNRTSSPPTDTSDSSDSEAMYDY